MRSSRATTSPRSATSGPRTRATRTFVRLLRKFRLPSRCRPLRRSSSPTDFELWSGAFRVPLHAFPSRGNQMTITPQLIKELREQTGAGFGDVKSALTEANGNMEEATKILRKKGLAAAGKKAGRVTAEGAVVAHVDGKTGVLVEVNCETDF